MSRNGTGKTKVDDAEIKKKGKKSSPMWIDFCVSLVSIEAMEIRDKLE